MLEQYNGIRKMDISNIGKLYQVAILEGQGLGTAYEYLVKQRLLSRTFKTVGYPKSILVAGLPEKYGYSMDFVMLANCLNAAITVLDEDSSKLDEFNRICNTLKDRGFLTKTLNLQTICISSWDSAHLPEGLDMAISCEVFQRLASDTKERYIEQLCRVARHIILFAPNAGNKGHAKISRLRTVSMEDVKRSVTYAGLSLVSCGYLDMPPLPPGLKWAGLKKPTASKRRIQSVLIMALTLWSQFENVVGFLKSKNAHIVYCVASVTENSAKGNVQLKKSNAACVRTADTDL